MEENFHKKRALIPFIEWIDFLGAALLHRLTIQIVYLLY